MNCACMAGVPGAVISCIDRRVMNERHYGGINASAAIRNIVFMKLYPLLRLVKMLPPFWSTLKTFKSIGFPSDSPKKRRGSCFWIAAAAHQNFSCRAGSGVFGTRCGSAQTPTDSVSVPRFSVRQREAHGWKTGVITFT